jgi:succinate dehydrogenase / fumarate reductase cytochrome b subunit
MSAKRPLSPHLMIYRPQLTSMMSITHRLTGVALGLGSLFFVLWLVALAHGGTYYDFVRGIAEHALGRLVLLGFFVAVSYHLANGIRHLFWDFGIGLSLQGVYRGGYAVLCVAALATLGGIYMLFLG